MKFTKYKMNILSIALLLICQAATATPGATEAEKRELKAIAEEVMSYSPEDFDGTWSAAVGGTMWSEYYIGQMYEQWANIHHKPMANAIYWYRRAAAQGHAEAAEALTRLGA